MAFDLRAIAILGAASLPYAGLLPARARGWALLVVSVVAIYWFQTALSIRYSDFILPTLTLGLTVAAWWLVRLPDRPEQQATAREDRLVVVTMAVRR